MIISQVGQDGESGESAVKHVEEEGRSGEDTVPELLVKAMVNRDERVTRLLVKASYS